MAPEDQRVSGNGFRTENFDFSNQGHRYVKKNSGGAQKKKSKINHSLVQIKNPHFLHFQMAISVVDINLLLCVKQKFHGACLGVSLLLCLMCLKLRGFQIDNCVFQRDLNSENLKVQVY